jgi:hypothetical protein
VFSEILERWRQNRALRKFSQSVLGDALRIHTQKYLNETVIRGVSSELKQKIVKQFSNRLIAIDKAPNPFLTFREELCNAAIWYADLQVLSLTPEEKAETFSHVRYISGELSPYIREAADFNKEVARIIWEHPECTDDELIVFANLSGAIYLYYLNGWNLVRVATKIDPAYSADKDWFGPFVTSMLISSEDNARQKLGLPSLFTDGSTAPLPHASFMSIVANGEANPLFEWERSYGRKHREES